MNPLPPDGRRHRRRITYPTLGEFRVQRIREASTEYAPRSGDSPEKIAAYWRTDIATCPWFTLDSDAFGGWTCQIDQRHYGHFAPKPTWLYAVGTDLPELNWTKSDRTPPQWMILRYGESKARRIGQVAMIGGKDKTKIRNASPDRFRDLLLRMAMGVQED